MVLGEGRRWTVGTGSRVKKKRSRWRVGSVHRRERISSKQYDTSCFGVLSTPFVLSWHVSPSFSHILPRGLNGFLTRKHATNACKPLRVLISYGQFFLLFYSFFFLFPVVGLAFFSVHRLLHACNLFSKEAEYSILIPCHVKV